MPKLQLTTLAARINAAHKAIGERFEGLLEKAIEAGELLIKAKVSMPHGEWLPWLRENCPDGIGAKKPNIYATRKEQGEVAKARPLRIYQRGARSYRPQFAVG